MNVWTQLMDIHWVQSMEWTNSLICVQRSFEVRCTAIRLCCCKATFSLLWVSSSFLLSPALSPFDKIFVGHLFAFFPYVMDPCEYVIVHAKLPPSPVILCIELSGKPKWLPLNLGFMMRTSPIGFDELIFGLSAYFVIANMIQMAANISVLYTF